jgi:hypothetical protein
MRLTLYYSFSVLLISSSFHQNPLMEVRDRNGEKCMSDSINQFPAYPSGEKGNDLEELAELILKGFPPEQRESAQNMLIQSIFPNMTRGIDSHPDLQRMYKYVYERIVEELTDIDPLRRLTKLNKIYFETEIVDIVGKSLSLAVACFIKRNPDTLDQAINKNWVQPEVLQLLKLSPEAIKKEGESLRERITTWQHDVKTEFPEVLNVSNLELLQIDMNLNSVADGNYTVAIGSFYDFLCDLDFRVQTIEIH